MPTNEVGTGARGKLAFRDVPKKAVIMDAHKKVVKMEVN